MDEARQAFVAGLVDEPIMDDDDFEEDLASDLEERLGEFKRRHAPINVVDQCGGWVCFRNEEDDVTAEGDLLPGTVLPE